MSGRSLFLVIGALAVAGAAAAYVVLNAGSNSSASGDGYARFARGELEDLQVLAAPPELPDIIFLDDEGGRLTLADFDGQVILVNIWAVWCAPCVHELPSLDRLEADLGSERFKVVAITLDRNLDDSRRFFSEHGITSLDLYQETSTALANAMESDNKVPLTVLYSADGRELARLAGGAEWDSREAKALINAAIEDSFAAEDMLGDAQS